MGLNNITNNIKIPKPLVLSDIFTLGKRLKHKHICNTLIKQVVFCMLKPLIVLLDFFSSKTVIIFLFILSNIINQIKMSSLILQVTVFNFRIIKLS